MSNVRCSRGYTTCFLYETHELTGSHEELAHFIHVFNSLTSLSVQRPKRAACSIQTFKKSIIIFYDPETDYFQVTLHISPPHVI